MYAHNSGGRRLPDRWRALPPRRCVMADMHTATWPYANWPKTLLRIGFGVIWLIDAALDRRSWPPPALPSAQWDATDRRASRAAASAPQREPSAVVAWPAERAIADRAAAATAVGPIIVALLLLAAAFAAHRALDRRRMAAWEA